MVDSLVKASQQYAIFYRQTKQRKGDEQLQIIWDTGNNRRRQSLEEENEYRDTLYVDPVFLKNRGQAQTMRRAKTETKSVMTYTDTVQICKRMPQQERAIPHDKVGEWQKVALSNKDREFALADADAKQPRPLKRGKHVRNANSRSRRVHK